MHYFSRRIILRIFKNFKNYLVVGIGLIVRRMFENINKIFRYFDSNFPSFGNSWVLLENCTKQEMSESVHCQESIPHAASSSWLQNIQSVRPSTPEDEDRNTGKILQRRFALILPSGDPFSWNNEKHVRSPMTSRVSRLCHLTACHYQVW